MKKKMTNENEWPGDYPVKLRPVSWHVGADVAGPHKYFNRHLDYSTKGSSLFVKEMVKMIFYKNGVPLSDKVDEIAQFFATSFTVFFTDDDGEFKLTPKKDKTTGKRAFDAEKWKKLLAGAGLDKKGMAAAFLRTLCTELISAYNGMLNGGVK